jgi:hypothetical protein
MPQHCLCLASLSRFFDFTLSESFHVPSYRLHEGQSRLGRKGQNCFGLELPEVNAGHALTVVLEHDVTIFGATDESAPVARGIVPHGTKLLKLSCGMIVATPPLLNHHTCLRSPSEPLESILHDPALL